MGSNENNPDDKQLAEHLMQIHDQVMKSDTGISSSSRQSASIQDDVDENLDRARQVMEMIHRARAHADVADETINAGSTATENLAQAQPSEILRCLDTSHMPSEDLEQPITLDRFEIVRQLGGGGYGLVFLARDPELGRMVALKVPRPQVVLTDELVNRFIREAKMAAALSHPNIVAVFEAGRAGPICYIASQYIEGQTLAECLQQSPGFVEPQMAAELVAVLAEAVHHAHQRGVLHRDLKPGNVLLAWDDSPKPTNARADEKRVNSEKRFGLNILQPLITDFGLAKLIDDQTQQQTKTDAIVGTPAYMSPEQARGGKTEIGPATDIYSLGAILYQLLTDKPPFEAESVLETLKLVQAKEPVAPRRIDRSVPRELQAVCLKCLEKSPTSRYATANDLVRDLNHFINGEPVLAHPPTAVERAAKWCRRNPVVAGLSATAVLLMIAALIGWISTANALWQARAAKLDADLRLQDSQLAVNELLIAVENSPEMQLAGFEPLRRQLLTRAETFLRQFSKNAPDDPQLKEKHDDIRLNLARIKSGLSDYEGARSIADQLLIELPPPRNSTTQQIKQRIALSRFLALQYFRLGDVSRREHFVNTSLQLARQNFGGQTLIESQIELATTLSELAEIITLWGDKTLSSDLANEAVLIWDAISPENVDDHETLFAMGKAYAASGKAYAAAGQAAKAKLPTSTAIDVLELLYADPKSATPETRNLLTEAHRVMGFLHDKNFASAMASFERAREIVHDLLLEHPLVPAYHIRRLEVEMSCGLSHAINGRAQESFAFFDKNVMDIRELIVRFPGSEKKLERILVTNYSMIGYACYETKNHEKALQTDREARLLYEKQFEKTGGSPQSVLDLAMCDGMIATELTALNRLDEAIKIFDKSRPSLLKLIDEDPENGSAKRFLWGDYESLALIYRKKGEHERALQLYQQGMPYFYGDVTQLYAREATYLARAGNLEEAVSKFQVFVEFQPRDKVYADTGHPADFERAMQASSLISAMIEAQDSEISDPRRKALMNQVVLHGQDSLAAIRKDPELGQPELNKLLDSPKMFPYLIAAGKHDEAVIRFEQSKEITAGEDQVLASSKLIKVLNAVSSSDIDDVKKKQLIDRVAIRGIEALSGWINDSEQEEARTARFLERLDLAPLKETPQFIAWQANRSK